MVGVPLPGPHAAGLLVPQWLLISTSFFVILARINLRLRIQRVPMMLSDYLMCCAWLSSVATASFDVVFARKGILRPDIDYYLTTYEGSAEDFEYLYKMIWVSQFPFDMTLYFAKAALLALYVRLFPVFMRKRRTVLWAVIVYTAAAYLVTELTSLLICRPIEGNWSLDPEVSCAEYAIVVSFFLGWALHFSTDVLIFIVPFMVLNQLQMRRTLKAGVYCTFLLGLITIAFSLTRFLTLYDPTGSRFPSFSLVELWCALDCNISVLVACLPSLRPYFSRSFWRGYNSNPSDGVSGSSGNKITSGKYSGGSNNGRASTANAARRHHFEAGMTFSEEDYPYAGPRPGAAGAGGLGVKLHQLSPGGKESPLDDGGKKFSIGDSDIELLVQQKRNVDDVV